MTETKRCCEKCSGGAYPCRNTSCVCHGLQKQHTVPVSEPSLQGKIEKVLENVFGDLVLDGGMRERKAAKAILALVEGDVCDKHKKEDCMECFYTTQPIDPTPTPPPTEWEERFDEELAKLITKFVMTATHRNFVPEDNDAGSYLKEVVLQALAEQKASMVEIVEGMREPNQSVSEWYSGFNAALDKVKVTIIKALSK